MYDIYNLNSPFVTPTAPAPAATVQATATTRRSADRLMRGSAYLLTFAGVLLLAALIVAVTPLGRIDADITVPFVAVFVGGLGAVVWATVRA
jgi:hypothetical protein